MEQEDKKLFDELIKILSNHCGEDGDNEGAVETLNRIIGKAKRLDKLEGIPFNQAYKESFLSSERDVAKLEQEVKHLKAQLTNSTGGNE